MKKMLLLTLVLVACASTNTNSTIHTSKYVIRSEMQKGLDFEIHTIQLREGNKNSEWMSYIDDLDHFQISYPADYPNERPVFMSDLSIKRPSLNTKCDSQLTGSSEIKILNNANRPAAWGRMDAWDGYGQEGFDWPANWEQMPCKKEGVPPPEEVYVLCAEKDGKTVVICINQMTDNPEQAKEIFETFRWTE